MKSKNDNQLKVALIKSEAADKTDIDSIIYNCIISFLLLEGMALTLSKAVGTSIVIWGITVACALFPVIQAVLERITKKNPISIYVPMILQGIISAVLIKYTANGLLMHINDIYASISRGTGKILPQTTLILSGSRWHTTLWFVFAVSVMSVLAAQFVKTGKAYYVIGMPIVAMVAACYTNQISLVGMVFLCVYTVCVIMKHMAASNNNSVSKEKKKGVPFESVGLVIFVICMVGILGAVKPGKLTERMSDFRDKLYNNIESIRYGGNDPLPGGDFTKLVDFKPTDKKKLEVVMEKPDSYYLRGFVGSKYKGSGWATLDKETLYKNSDLFYWLHNDGFYGQTQLAQMSKKLDKGIGEGTIKIKNLDASSKYIYAPYEVSGAGESILQKDRIGDDRLFANGFKGQRVYEYVAVPNQVKRYTNVASMLSDAEKNDDADIQTYINEESHYNEYVYKSLLDVPESTRQVIESLLGKYKIEEHKHMDYATAKQNILAFLTSNMEYSTKGSKLSNNQDFASVFLQETRTGYSVHFATAATLMFRYYGIPARYVEGYLITPKDVKGLLSNNSVKLDEKHAHAWTEFYQDGVGWIPFETTPPYIDVMEKAEDISGIDTGDGIKNNKPPENNNKHDADKEDGVNEMIKILERAKHFIVPLIIGILLVLITAIVVVILKRRKKLKDIYESFKDSDKKKSSLALFDYTTSFLYHMKVFENINDVYTKHYEMTEQLDEEYCNKYKKAFEIYEKAKFSNSNLEEADYDFMEKFKDDTIAIYKARRTKTQRFRDRHIRYIYF